MNQALLVIGHGSRDQTGNDECRALVQRVADRRSDRLTKAAFLEFEPPTIAESIDELAAAGAERIVCQPVMLFASKHVLHDIPYEVGAARGRWPQVRFAVGGAIGSDARVVEVATRRWHEAVEGRTDVPTSDTALVVIGRGWRDATVRSAFQAIARSFANDYGVGHLSSGFAGVCSPSIAEAIDRAVRTGVRRVVVQPLLVFYGELVHRIQRAVRDAVTHYSRTEILATSHLGPHPILADLVAGLGESTATGSVAVGSQTWQTAE